ncbi:MAG: glycosyltransferase family 2 protein, partial [Gemmataceae bacterium]
MSRLIMDLTPYIFRSGEVKPGSGRFRDLSAGLARFSASQITLLAHLGSDARPRPDQLRLTTDRSQEIMRPRGSDVSPWPGTGFMTVTKNGVHGKQALDELIRGVPHLPHAERVAALRHLLGEAACRELGIYPIPEGFKLSVVIPVFNEERWIEEVLRRVQAVEIPKEIIIVDDCSTDRTREILSKRTDDNIKIIFQEVNQGKGAALRRGFQEVNGNVVIVQDADLEYDPAEFPKLLQPIMENKADVVYGSRFIGESHRVL